MFAYWRAFGSANKHADEQPHRGTDEHAYRSALTHAVWGAFRNSFGRAFVEPHAAFGRAYFEPHSANRTANRGAYWEAHMFAYWRAFRRAHVDSH
jgi:hypothetical protein